LAASAGRKSLALKRIFEVVLVICVRNFSSALAVAARYSLSVVDQSLYRRPVARQVSRTGHASRNNPVRGRACSGAQHLHSLEYVLDMGKPPIHGELLAGSPAQRLAPDSPAIAEFQSPTTERLSRSRTTALTCGPPAKERGGERPVMRRLHFWGN
jgi:hypothetical protein